MVQRETEFSDPEISYCLLALSGAKRRYGSPQLFPTALRFARLVTCVEPPQQIPRSSESAEALSAGYSCYEVMYIFFLNLMEVDN